MFTKCATAYAIDKMIQALIQYTYYGSYGFQGYPIEILSDRNNYYSNYGPKGYPIENAICLI